MHGTYNPYLVAVSLLVAVLASYTILDLSVRIRTVQVGGLKRELWLFGGAIAIGSGIWSMHFIGMLACKSHMQVVYEPWITALSLLLAIGTSYVALHWTIREQITAMQLATGSSLLATGIVSMHYVGMAAIRVEPALQYRPVSVSASIVVAFVFSWAALWIALKSREYVSGCAIPQLLGSSVLMGLAIAGMHYVGMSAVVVPQGAVFLTGGLSSNTLPLLVVLLSLFWIFLALVVSRLDSRLDHLTLLADLAAAEVEIDSMTGMSNRTSFLDQTEEKMAKASADGSLLGILFLNLDGFKTINDSLGFLAGDELLKAFSEDLLRRVRSETLVGRFGGDEFAVLIEDVGDSEALVAIARSIFERLQKSFRIDGMPLRVTASGGVAIYPQDGATVAALVKSANIAMYTAKQQGKNLCRFFDRAMRDAADRSIHINRSLGHALEQGQLSLVYQPKFDGRANRMLGAEALIRWNHPVAGNIPPLEFIPIAEQTGQIEQISEWVITEVCRQLKTWEGMGLPSMRIAINLSPEQLMQEGFAARIHTMVAEAGVSPRSLLFEITETAVMREPKLAVEMIRQFQQAGFDFAIDDFGTGYSSMAYLQQFRVKELKIDRFFIGSLELGGAEQHTIVSAIIALAHALHMTVVAEGVETANQLSLLQGMNCDEIQGYLMGRPMNAASFEKLLRAEVRQLNSAAEAAEPDGPAVAPILHAALA